MFEILFIFGVIAWVALTFIEWLAGLPMFLTLATAVVVVPLGALWSYARLVGRLELGFLRERRRVLPPERFWWPAQAARLRREVWVLTVVGVVSWPVAMAWPARWDLGAASLTGWIAGLVAIATTTAWVARMVLYFRAAQRFDRLSPAVVGWLRRTMFRLSDNYEFLGEESEVPRRKERESIY